jgi:hypothetical protein
MKLEVEIKDNTFNYRYEIGDSVSDSNSPLSADQLVLFANLINNCVSVTNKSSNERWDEITAKAWMEKNGKEAKEFLEKNVK